jgi:hypothetical protein
VEMNSRWCVTGFWTGKSAGIQGDRYDGNAVESTTRLSRFSGWVTCLRRSESGREERRRVHLMEDSLPGSSQKCVDSAIVPKPDRPDAPEAALP